MDNNTNTNEELDTETLDEQEVAGPEPEPAPEPEPEPDLTPEGKITQLEHAVEFWKKRAREESPSALHQELSRLKRACMHIANMTGESRVMQAVEESRVAPQARSHPALRMSSRGRASFSPDLLVQRLRQVHRVASSALSDKPSRVRIPSFLNGKANDDQEQKQDPA